MPISDVAGGVGPAARGDGLADQGLVDEATEMGTHGGSGGKRPDGAGKPRILARDAGPGSCAQEAGAGLAGAGFAVSAGFAAGLASAAEIGRAACRGRVWQ